MTRSENFRLLLTLIAANDWDCVTIDVNNAFVNAKLSKPTFLRIGPGMEGNPKTECWRLVQALYGLKTSPKDWNQELSGTLKSLGFQRTHSDWNLFYKFSENGAKIFVGFHVDDGLLTSNNSTVLKEVVRAIGAKYKIKVSEDPNFFLGISIRRDRQARLLGLNQASYIRECAIKFQCNTLHYSTPMEPGFVSQVDSADSTLPASYPR